MIGGLILILLQDVSAVSMGSPYLHQLAESKMCTGINHSTNQFLMEGKK
jgi:hypothetical protein